MPGKLFFVHGTGVRDVTPAMEKIRAGVKSVLAWDEGAVVPIEWGRAVGPQPLDVSIALPPEQADRGIDNAMLGSEAGRDESSALWDLLLVDPAIELRLLAEQGPAAEVTIVPGVEAPEVVFEHRLRGLALPDEALADAGFSLADVRAAAQELADNPAVNGAAAAAGGLADGEVVEGAARAVVATMIAHTAADWEADALAPAATSDAQAREALVVAVAGALAPESALARGFVIDKIVAPLATRYAVSKRAAFMAPFCDFARDVTFYLEHGKMIRDLIANAIREAGDASPVVLLAHSLGGIAAVDLLADQTEMSGARALKVDLLVTVGSQAPILYLMDSLSSLSPKTPDTLPFVPWLNIYNREDLLSFCAKRVFPARTTIVDEPVDAGVPFPMSHSAYWGQRRTYELIKESLP
jgi:hypothetical protein